jgi:hypothetical protein
MTEMDLAPGGQYLSAPMEKAIKLYEQRTGMHPR